jgi:hypothetical protein
MIPQVKSLEEAMDFFLSHASGSCVGVKSDGTKLILDSYKMAQEFFK